MYTALIVDDEALVRFSIGHMLKNGANEVQLIGEAENGRQALALADSLKPDILITDIKMPGMDGLELLQRLAEQKKKPATVILSGFADFSYAQQGIRYGVLEYILKPVKQADLDRAMALCIQTLPARRNAGQSLCEKLIAYLDASFAGPLTLEGLAVKFSFSTKHLASLIKAETGKSFTEYIQDRRITKSIELLTKTNLEIKAIASESGYDDLQYFHRVFKRKTGLTPQQYRKARLVGKETARP